MVWLKVSDLRIGKVKHDRLFLNQYLMENGLENRRIQKSPHYVLLSAIEKNPSIDLRKTDYFRFAMTYVNHFGAWFGKKDAAGVIMHMDNFIRLYKEISIKGFDYKNGRLIVFQTVHNVKSIDKHMRPHPPTSTYIPENYEIFEGHHRAAILAKLGYEYVDVDFYSGYSVFLNKVKKLFSRLRK